MQGCTDECTKMEQFSKVRLVWDYGGAEVTKHVFVIVCPPWFFVPKMVKEDIFYM